MDTNIYALTEPDGTIRYVGKTAKPLKIRLAQHWKSRTIKRRQNRHLINWIRKLDRNGHRPAIVLLEAVAGDGSVEERKWIADLSKRYRLVNQTDGGETSWHWTEEAKAAMSAKMKLIKANVSEDTKRKIALAATGRRHSETSKRKMSRARIGKLRSDTTRLKISEGNRLWWESNRGTVRTAIHSEETKRKMSEARRRYWQQKKGKHAGTCSENLRGN